MVICTGPIHYIGKVPFFRNSQLIKVGFPIWHMGNSCKWLAEEGLEASTWLRDRVGVWPSVGQVAPTEAGGGASQQVVLDLTRLPFGGSGRPESLPSIFLATFAGDEAAGKLAGAFTGSRKLPLAMSLVPVIERDFPRGRLDCRRLGRTSFQLHPRTEISWLELIQCCPQLVGSSANSQSYKQFFRSSENKNQTYGLDCHNHNK